MTDWYCLLGFFSGGGFGFGLWLVFQFIHNWKKEWRTIIEEIHLCICFQRFFFFFFPHVSFLRAVFWMRFSIISSRHIPRPCLPGLWVLFKSRDSFKASFISILCPLFRTFAPVMLNFSMKTQVRHPRAPGLGLEPVQFVTCPLEGADPQFTESPANCSPLPVQTHFWSSQPWFIPCPWKLPELSHQWAGGFALILA